MKSSHFRRQSGLTLLELVIVVAIAAVVGFVAVPSYRSYVLRAQSSAAIADVTDIHLRIQTYLTNWGALPADLGDVHAADKLDPWGNPYVYLSFDGLHGQGQMRKDKNLVPVNSQYDLYSKGPDGESRPPFTARHSRDDIVLANDGGYIGVVSEY